MYLYTHTHNLCFFNLGSEMNLWSLNLLLHLHLFFIYRLWYMGEALSRKWPCASAFSPIHSQQVVSECPFERLCVFMVAF